MSEQGELGMLAFGAALWLAALLIYFFGYRRSARRYDAIANVPTIAAKDIPGLGASMVELKGIVHADWPLVSDLARIPCVVFHSQVTEHWTTTRVERDSKGNTRRVTEHHSETRYSNSGRIDFQLRDESGAATIHPAGAEIDLLDAMGNLDGPLPDSPAYDISPHHIGGYLSYSESVLPVEKQVYILGQVGPDNAVGRPQVVDQPFIISYRTEESLRSRAMWGKRIWGLFAVVFFLAGFLVLGFAINAISVPSAEGCVLSRCPWGRQTGEPPRP